MPGPLREQQFEYNKQAEFDADGNIYVSSDQGKLIRMADPKHCSEAHVANDQQTVGCRVMQNQELGNTVPSFRLEIYRKGGYKGIIEPGEPILDWHFWKDGQQVAVSSGLGDGPTTYALYDSATSRIIEKLPAPPDEALLPQWATSAAQIQDESVPITPELSQQRTQWIGKLLRQISKIKPGMSRGTYLEYLQRKAEYPLERSEPMCIRNAPTSKSPFTSKPWVRAPLWMKTQTISSRPFRSHFSRAA